MRFLSLIAVLCMSLFGLTSCQRTSGSAWEDVKTLGRYIQRNSKMLLKKHTDSKMISDREEFFAPIEDEFIPLNQGEMLSAQGGFTQQERKEETRAIAHVSEKEIPNIDSFRKPSAELSSIFKLVHFQTDSHVLQDKEYISTIENMAKYLKKHPDTYVFVVGHCDERASEAYNLALGTRRANYVRSLLLKHGVDANHVFTISYGKELPLDSSHTKESWAKNRRAEFKIYQKNM